MSKYVIPDAYQIAFLFFKDIKAVKSKQRATVT